MICEVIFVVANLHIAMLFLQQLKKTIPPENFYAALEEFGL